MQPITIVSADSHVCPHYQELRSYIDPAYRDRLDDLAVEDQLLRDVGIAYRNMINAGLEGVVDDRGLLAADEQHNSADLKRLVRSPVFSADTQSRALAAILDKAGISGIAANFLKVLTANRRLFAVGDVRAGSVKRVASAVGEGSVVVSAVHSFLAGESGL